MWASFLGICYSSETGPPPPLGLSLPLSPAICARWCVYCARQALHIQLKQAITRYILYTRTCITTHFVAGNLDTTKLNRSTLSSTTLLPSHWETLETLYFMVSFLFFCINVKEKQIDKICEFDSRNNHFLLTK